jgi:hypothetical protein
LGRQFHWLQFDYRYRKDNDGKYVGGTYRTGNGLYYPYKKDGWHVDSRSTTDPWYDTEGEATRTKFEVSMFDKPTFAELDHCKYSEEGQVNETFLMSGRNVYFRVHWEIVTRWNKDTGEWDTTVQNVTGEKASKLPSWADPNKLPGGYRDRGLKDPVFYSLPQE